ncbi:MAG: hypothetical protein Q9163_005936 [Psora crenata]
MAFTPLPAGGFILDQELPDLKDSGPVPSRQTLMNQLVMEDIEAALKSDPECDILSIIPPSYKSEITKESAPPSKIALLNRTMIDVLQSLTNETPEIDLLSHFPKRYRMEYDRGMADPGCEQFRIYRPPKAPDTPPKDTLSRIASAATATVVFPLSDAVNDLISHHTSGTEESLTSSEKLAFSMKRLFKSSDKLWEYPFRGAVFRCSDEVVAKVISGFRRSTEYTSMQYLQEHAPEIPAPRPHGLVNLGGFWAIFMTYIPSVTLEEAWPSLCHEQKVSVQHQLSGILTRMRELKQPDGLPLGGVGGEGVNDLHQEDYRNDKDKPIDTLAGFEDFKFSLSKFASEAYVRFLKSLLPPRTTQSVFTHGDLRPANIMVQMDERNDCVVKGIIDWEDSGFYPDFHEATKCTNLMEAGENTDWYEYLPKCISASSFPQWWLVDRLWGRNIHLGI